MTSPPEGPWESVPGPLTILPGPAPAASAVPAAPPAGMPVVPPAAPRRSRLPRPGRPRLPGVSWLGVATVVALVIGALASLVAVSARQQATSARHDIAAQSRALGVLRDQVSQMQSDIGALRTSLGQTAAGSIDTKAVAPKVLRSVFTIETPFSLGTAFAVQHSDSGGTILVTNYHVVAAQWTSGGRSVTLKQGSRTISGKINTVRPTQDLASVEVVADLPLLPLTKTVPPVGSPVLVVGSPLGLGGTVTTGVVSAHRTEALQISAPISPGNSGGPVVDRTGRVVGIASSKIVSNYAEGLGFAIPVRTVCSVLLTC